MIWKSIETAPKDGRTILACYADTYDINGFMPICVKWKAYHPNAKGAEEWRDSNGHKIRGLTHWMELPEPPAYAPILRRVP